ncbi:phosphatase PAP2 family protein [Pleionea sp. CnH1-48]|uniref:phosphatase PAP2 family protein n=1 Tax=Pleionea sp. CnH1-48 TaxID=2954494 RepID=UPI0020980BFF|nr:phosphatase PAP2 family protein [Pleionea sp. CnH1-48]MCO7225706.1 phosphatase PAP2 family protein [Pleionea sp. CnH1-48]
MDTHAFLWVTNKQGCHYRRLVRFISRTGDGPLYAVIGLTLCLLEPIYGTTFFLTALLAYGIEVSLYLILKNAIKRDRPCDRLTDYQAWIKPSDQFSFPSGHTAAGFVFAVMVYHFYPAYSLSVFIWAGLIGLSRIIQGVHYPGDIAAGALLGIFAASSALYLVTTF